MKDDKFKSKMKDYIIYKDLDGKYLSLKDYLEKESIINSKYK